jgi:hypothetical protein
MRTTSPRLALSASTVNAARGDRLAAEYSSCARACRRVPMKTLCAQIWGACTDARRTCSKNTPLASAGFATRVRRPVNRATLLSCRTTTQSLSPEPPVHASARRQRARHRRLPRRSPSGAVSESKANEEMTGALPRHSPARTTEPPLGRNCQMRAWCDGQHTCGLARLQDGPTHQTQRLAVPALGEQVNSLAHVQRRALPL